MEKLNLQRFGEEPEAAENAQTEGAGEKARESGPSFQELIGGAYRQDYERAVGQRIQAAIQQRFKNQKDYQKQAQAAQPIVEALSARYGIPADDWAGVAQRFSQEQAGSAGAPGPETRQEQAPGEEREASPRLRRHFLRLRQEAEELRREFPGFDLFQEMGNPAFARMTAPGMDVSLRHAFYAVHGPALEREGMAYAAQQAEARIAASVAAGASRPQENGLGKPADAPWGLDVTAMDRKARAEYRRRIHNGEKINFQDQL